MRRCNRVYVELGKWRICLIGGGLETTKKTGWIVGYLYIAVEIQDGLNVRALLVRCFLTSTDYDRPK